MLTPLNQYDVIGQAIATAGKDLQVFVDSTLKRRNTTASWKNWYTWGTKKMSRSFDAMEADADLLPMASVIDTNAPKPKRALQGISLYQGKIPKMGHSFDLTEDNLLEYYTILERGGSIVNSEVLALLFNNINKLEFGAHARINSMGYAAMSTGHIVLNTDNNPDGGVIMDLDMRIPTSNKKFAGFGSGVSAVWTDPTSTPTQDILDIMTYCDDNYIPYDVMKWTKAKYREYVSHPNTVLLINGRKSLSDTAAVSKSDVDQFMIDMGFPKSEIIDEKSGLQIDGETTNIESFDTDNIVFSKEGKLGEVKSASPITIPDPAVRVAWSEGNRIQMLQYFDGKAKTQGFDMECLALPVLNQAKKMVILDTMTVSSWT